MPTGATGTSYLVTYRLDDHDGSLLPPPHPTNVGHYADTFAKLDGAWLLQRRVTHLAFGGPTPARDEPCRKGWCRSKNGP